MPVNPGDTFGWRGRQLAYLTHPYNRAAENERAVEVPIAADFLAGVEGDGIEVGNVTRHYLPELTHRVVDLYEDAPHVEQRDVLDLTELVPWVLAISTLEHVRWDHDPVDPHAAAHACRLLRHLLLPGGQMLATVPFGQHPHLDHAILSGDLEADREATLEHAGSRWVIHDGKRLPGPLRENTWPTSVWVGEWSA